ncbi:MAG: transglutaminase domain-containing protein [Bacteroidota bacterium]
MKSIHNMAPPAYPIPMMKSFMGLLIFLFASLLSLQSQTAVWEVQTPPLLPFQVIDTFPDEEAVILLKKGRITTGFDGMYVSTFVRMIILKEAGLENAEVNIPYLAKGGAQNIVFPLARTWNWDGKTFQKTELKRKDIHEAKLDNEVSEVSFVLPQVKVGSIIDYQFYLKKRSIVSYNWRFQSKYPTLRNELKFHRNEEMFYQKVFQNGLNLELQTVEDDENHWLLEHIPAMEEEPFIDNIKDYAPKMMLQLAAYAGEGIVETLLLDWEEFTKDIYDRKLLGRYLKKDKTYAATVKQLVGAIQKKEDKIKRLYDYVQHEVKWNGEFESFTDKKISEIHRSGKGNSAEITLLLTHLIRAAGIEAYPMLVSTRDHGPPIEAFPLMRQFNSLLCYAIVDDNPMILDAIDPLLPFSRLPEKDLNGMGFVLEKDNGRWEAIPQPAQTSHNIMTQLQLNEEGVLSGILREQWKGYLAYDYRLAIQASSSEEFVSAYQAEKLPQGEILDYTFEDLETVDQPLSISMTIATPDFCQQTGEYLYLSPLLMMRWEENPFSQSERIYPVDLHYPTTYSGLIVIELPEGYQIESLPKSSKMKLPEDEMSFAYFVQVMPPGKSIQIQYQFQINKTLYSPDEYPNLKLMYDVVMARHSEQIVLRKQ